MPGLVSSHLLPGYGHGGQEERPTNVNEILLDWLRKVHPAPA
jgi:pimeloyl-ACP methyl ester carboxylesterase